jgi:hypothetical protein
MKSLRKFFLLACVFLMACSGGLHDNADPIAQTASFVVVEQIPGTTPFIGRVIVSVDHYDDLASVAYTIAPKPGTFSKPVSVTYDKAWLDRNASYNRIAQLLGIYVFGLYSGYQNAVDVTVKYRDGAYRPDDIADRRLFRIWLGLHHAFHQDPARTSEQPRGRLHLAGQSVDGAGCHRQRRQPEVGRQRRRDELDQYTVFRRPALRR